MAPGRVIKRQPVQLDVKWRLQNAWQSTVFSDMLTIHQFSTLAPHVAHLSREVIKFTP
jgi:hypothetical protein